MVPSQDELVVTAIISAYNEGDVIAQVIADLIAQGLRVYLIDHGSEDDTVEQATPFLDRGLLRIERFPEESGFPEEDAGRFAWTHLLQRKELLAAELDSDWFIHHDADELRESPWSAVSLRDAIRRVDHLGYNAIEFETYNFPPTRDGFQRGDDLRSFFRHCEHAAPFDKLQIKCWKKQPERIDLASSGGHDARFANRRVFPLRFILRHFPVRSQAHGERKVFQERLPRFLTAERAAGWHVQYDHLTPQARFVRDPAELLEFDLEAVRVDLTLRSRPVERATAELGSYQQQFPVLLEALHHEQRLAAELRGEFAALAGAHRDLDGELDRLRAEGLAGARLLEQVTANMHAQAQTVETLQAHVAERVRELEATQRQREELAEGFAARGRQLDQAQALREELTRALEARERGFEQAQQQRDELSRAFDARTRQAEETRGQLAGAHRQLEETRGQLADTHRQLEETRGQLAETRGQLGDALAQLEGALARAEEARRRQEELARAFAAQSLELQSAHRERAELTRALGDGGIERDGLRGLAEARAAELAATRTRLGQLERELEHALAELARAADRIDELYSSRSWRLSAAMREAWRLIGRH